MKASKFYGLFIALAVLVVAPSSFAEDATSGTLSGNVLSQGGNAVSGATVVIESSATGVGKSSASNADGSVRFPMLPIGSYQVTVSAAGFDTLDDTIYVRVGNSAYDFVLVSSATGIEEIVVTAGAREAMDFDSTTTGISIDVADLISKTPLSRNMTSLVLLAPGTSKGDSAFGNLASISGSSVAENAYIINGLNITNFRNFTGGSTVPFEFLEEVQVKTGGYAAEFGKAIGGVVNSVTKSGSNEFEFSINASFYPDSLYETQPDTFASLNSHDQNEYLEYNVSVSGPIIKDRVFFYLLANPNDDETDYPTVSGTMYNRADKEEFYGGKLDVFITDNIHLEYTYFTDENSGVRESRDYDDTTSTIGNELKGTTYYNTGGDNKITKLSWAFNDAFTLAATYGENEYERTVAGTGDAYSWVWWPYPTASRGIASGLVTENGRDRREIFKIDADLYIGKHHLRIGFEDEDLNSVAQTTYSGSNAEENRGGYYYRGYDDNGNGVIEAGETLRLRVYKSGGSFDTLQKAVYIQDSWDATDRLNVNIGLRRSEYDNRNADGGTFIKVDGQDALRLGATFDVAGDGSSKLYASFGEYYLPIAANTNIRLSGGEYFSQQFCSWDGTFAGGEESIPGVEAGSCGALGLYGDGSVPDTRAGTDANIKPMHSEEIILGYQTTLERGRLEGWDMNVYFVDRDLASTIEDVLIDHAVLKWCADNGLTDDVGDGHSCEWHWYGTHQYVLTNPGEDMSIYLPEVDQQVTLTKEQLAYPAVNREYKGLTVELERPWDGDWSAKFSYTNSSTKGNYEGTVKSDNGQDDAGITQDFDFVAFTEGAYGKLPNHRAHNLKFFGSRRLTDNLIGGINFSALSPRYYGCIGNHPTDPNVYTASSWYCNGVLTPRGQSAKSDWVHTLDALLVYSPTVRRGDLKLKVDIFNVFNSDDVTDIYEYGETGATVGDMSPNYLKPTGYQAPRRVRLGFQWDFGL